MATLNWQDNSKLRGSHDPASGFDPWFGVAMGLSGLIVGFVAGAYLTAGSLQIAQAPRVPNAPLAAPQAPSAPQGQPALPQAPAGPPATAEDDPVLGDKNAPVTVIEFTDYQCPFCGRHFSDAYGQIKKDYIDTGKVKYVVRDFPLSFHPHAQKTAEATECADDQGKFWEMHDKIFAAQQAWTKSPDIVPTLKQYAAELKLDTGTFDTCLDSGKHKAEVQKDMADGTASGVRGTPGFWVLGPGGKSQNISGAVPFANFQQAIDAMLP